MVETSGMSTMGSRTVISQSDAGLLKALYLTDKDRLLALAIAICLMPAVLWRKGRIVMASPWRIAIGADVNRPLHA